LAEPSHVEAAEELAVVRCVECGRLQQRDDGWHLYYADLGEVAIYWPDCAEQEFTGGRQRLAPQFLRRRQRRKFERAIAKIWSHDL
jgi:hypothetical protein